ncbi:MULTISPECIES: efflux RND transporter periplasmic adaptor subunit [unclassified Thalassospira]|uniref:efflux RND transporter periplasmic adaptor subunit n=1 Tax=unclassified Thalassospira TaxID=2648997 RepID=UPI000EE5EC61|nr:MULTISPECIES: efflux RND transporter periplasmic adaptor subunit [unclassified Thalassospira]HAI30512.1 efflux RND transporter periplasmic adaptor subunit [Thalassospira sp.]|tara:strand:+ start:4923 stop:6095 length:1173 start_codon:yes stop_codon:yes gene_type:complete
MNASRLIAILLVVGTVIWIGSSYMTGDDATDQTAANDTASESETAKPLASVRTITSKAVDHVDHLRITGRTEAVISVEIRAETEARVVEIGAVKGQAIQKGDLIARLDIGDRQARVAKARALVAQRELEHSAAESLAQKNYRSKTGVAQALALLEEARADLTIARTELGNTEIRAPFDGIVEERPAEVGDLLSIGDPLATLIQGDPMLVVAHVPEHSIRAIDLGQLATVTLFDGSTHDGIVRYTARVSDNDTRTFRVEVEMENADLRIPDGMTAQLEIPVGTKRAHQVTSSVLTLNDEGELGVRAIVDDNKVDFLPVELQGGSRDRIWIGGLPEEFELIVVGHDWVKEGATANVVHLETDKDGLPIMQDENSPVSGAGENGQTLSENTAH